MHCDTRRLSGLHVAPTESLVVPALLTGDADTRTQLCCLLTARDWAPRAGQLVKFKSYSALHSARVRVLAGGPAVRQLRGTVLSVVADELGVEWQVPATGAVPTSTP